jgi:hypothetical protein
MMLGTRIGRSIKSLATIPETGVVPRPAISQLEDVVKVR